MTVDLFTWQIVVIGIVVFLYGIVIGSFLNVCIYRIPLKESLSKERSHCMKCGYRLRWYDLVPLFSYLFLGGRCRKCKEHISAQYPIIEGLNGVLYVLVFTLNGWSIDSVIYCLLTSTLIVLSVIDFRTNEIPVGLNLFILALGLIHIWFHLGDWVTYVISLFAVSSVMGILCWILGGKLIRRDDVLFMGTSGFLLGWHFIVLACLVGCILYALTYGIGKAVSENRHRLTMGPCLAIGIWIAMIWETDILNRYMNLLSAF